ncbi:MAG TPA: TlpA disulfide reductase family protein [Solirubrobacteraceae bacterium]|jgi:cytochrome c biogenesis protein CcmG/thiol:disulfide interchange protein DsbE
MRRFLIPGIVVAVVVALLALLAFGISSQKTNSSIDAAVARGAFPAAPNSNVGLPNLGTAGTTSLASLRGKVVVLNVFASWCGPCVAEAQVLEREQHRIVGHDATILGVTYLDNTNDSQTFVHRQHVTYPVVRDVNGSFLRSWGVDGVPETFVINRQGKVVALRRFQLAGNWLQQTVARVLQEPA